MASLPLLDSSPGLYQVCTNANTDYPVALATDQRGKRATSLVLWFEASATDSTIISGRVGFDADNTVETGLTGADSKLGYHPACPVEYSLAVTGAFADDTKRLVTYLHLANKTAGAVAKGFWTFEE